MNTFKFIHISTDEVFGSLGKNGFFNEDSPYSPNSPYSASKAASDFLVKAWNKTYNLPVIITNCSNNYGPFQFSEKLIPLMILKALKGENLPIYGSGLQIRDWLYVDDHADALIKIVKEGELGENYNIGARCEKTNLEVVTQICEVLDELVLEKPNKISTFKQLISYVEDRPGHDVRYAINSDKMINELGWKPLENFETGLSKTIRWYLERSDEITYDKFRIGRGNKNA